MVIHILIARNRLSVILSSRPQLTVALDGMRSQPSCSSQQYGHVPNGWVGLSCTGMCMLMKRSDPMLGHAMPHGHMGICMDNVDNQPFPSDGSKQQT